MMAPLHALLGGALIGLAAAALLVSSGRLAGISGIIGGVVEARRGDVAWRVAFLAGLLAGGLLLALVAPQVFGARGAGALPGPLLVAAGLLVGFGTQLGGGCTSGHGVCGLGRLSGRSLVAVLTFMTTGALSAIAVQHLLRGAS